MSASRVVLSQHAYPCSNLGFVFELDIYLVLHIYVFHINVDKKRTKSMITIIWL